MDADAVVRRAMEDDLGTNRVDSLPLEYNSRHLTYQPSRVKVVQNAESREASSVWTAAVKSGTFNDSDAASVMGLDDFGGPRQHDPRAQRLGPRPPPLSVSVQRSNTTSSATGGAVTSAVTRSPPTPLTTEGAGTRAGTRSPLANMERADSVQLSVPSRGPPTPAHSPTAPTSRASAGKPVQAGPGAVGSTSSPKLDRGLGASRWATGGSQSNGAAKSQARVPDQTLEAKTPAPEAKRPTSEAKRPTSEAKRPTSEVKTPASEAKSPESQAMPQPHSARYPICEATQGLSRFKISDDNTEAKVEAKPIDPMTGQLLGREVVCASKARLSVDRPDGMVTCGIYLHVKKMDCPVFEVFVQGKLRGAHNILDMLSQRRGGVCLELAFRGEANQIQTYSLELETEQEAARFLEEMKVLREIVAQALSEELKDRLCALPDTILAKQDMGPGLAPSPANVTTVIYTFGSSFRKTCSVNPKAKHTDTIQGILIPQADDTPPKSQRKTYTPDELTWIRKDRAATSMILVDGSSSIRAVKRSGRPKESVVGSKKEQTGPRTTNATGSSTVLDKLRQKVAEGNTWVSQNGGTGL